MSKIFYSCVKKEMEKTRKIMNLIALTVFLGTNLLTPISYAVDDLENV
jgi:hypothetical protein